MFGRARVKRGSPDHLRGRKVHDDPVGVRGGLRGTGWPVGRGASSVAMAVPRCPAADFDPAAHLMTTRIPSNSLDSVRTGEFNGSCSVPSAGARREVEAHLGNLG